MADPFLGKYACNAFCIITSLTANSFFAVSELHPTLHAARTAMFSTSLAVEVEEQI